MKSDFMRFIKTSSRPLALILILCFSAGITRGQAVSHFEIVHESVGAQDPTAIVWWNDLWYLSGPGGVIYRSRDGDAWNGSMIELRGLDGSPLPGIGNGPTQLDASANAILGINESNEIVRTLDGKIWHVIEGPDHEGDLVSLVHANGEWVLTGSNSLLYRSTNDGDSWTRITPNFSEEPADDYYEAAAYADGDWWLLIHRDLYRGSTLGSLEPVTLPRDVNWNVLYGDPVNDRVWISGGDYIAYKPASSDNWNEDLLEGGNGRIQTIVATEEWAIAGDNDSNFWVTRLLNYGFSRVPISESNRTIGAGAYNGEKVLFLAERESPSRADFVWTTADFETFESPTIGLTSRFYAMLEEDGIFYLAGDGPQVMSSEDGRFWERAFQVELPDTYNGVLISDLHYEADNTGPYWLAAGIGQFASGFNDRIRGVILRSEDRETWTPVYEDSEDRPFFEKAGVHQIHSPRTDDSLLFASAFDASDSFLGTGRILRSQDRGVSWEVALETPDYPTPVIGDNPFRVFSGDDVHTSTDGFNWSKRGLDFGTSNSRLILDAIPVDDHTLLLTSDAFANERWLVLWDGTEEEQTAVSAGDFLEGVETLFLASGAVLANYAGDLHEVGDDLTTTSVGRYPIPEFTVGFHDVIGVGDDLWIAGDAVVAKADFHPSKGFTDPVLSIFPQATKTGDEGWYELGAFGRFYNESDNFPWVYHDEFGYVFLTTVHSDPAFYSLLSGWFAMPDDSYPNLYSFRSGGWVFYEEGSNGTHFYDYALGDWVTVDEL